MKRENVNVMIFRRDFRVDDNSALLDLIDESLDSGLKILPIFIFNPNQIDPNKNQYFCKNSVEFMVQSLDDLNASLSNCLIMMHESDTGALNKLLRKVQINTIAFNRDYTPFAIERDKELTEWCDEKNIGVLSSDDYTLFRTDEIQTKTGKPYEMFTPFYNTCMKKAGDIPTARKLSASKLLSVLFRDMKGILKSLSVKNTHKYYGESPNPYLPVKGGRQNALLILERVRRGEFYHYDKERDFPSIDKTTKLGAYMKFGCVSVREVFHTVKTKHRLSSGLIKELIWREFYSMITYHFPHVLEGQLRGNHRNHTFKEKYDHLKWGFREDWWNAWCNGLTGFPWVDAGIRQLLATGWCHNRLRMALGMFFCKDMLFDWRIFERWMANHLVDYDPSSNSGGVQWTYSVGCDAAPYFRVFSPQAQPHAFDKDAVFIKRWIPELRTIPTKSIMNWSEDCHKYKHETTYPVPILNHVEQVQKAIKLFQ